MTKTFLTNEQAQQMTADFQRLFDLACTQLTEHKTWLKERIRAHAWTVHGWDALASSVTSALRILVDQVDGITLEVVRPEETVTALVKEGDTLVAKPTISIVYDYPDELFAFLTSMDAPEELRASMFGAHTKDLDKQAITVQRLPDTAGAVKAP